MNNTQLDMVLDYLNEGVELDEFGYLSESITEMLNASLQESTFITSLLEENTDDDKYEKSEGFLEKIKETIKRFIKWVTSLVTKIRIYINKLSIKILKSVISKNIEKQKEIAKSMKPDTKIHLNDLEFVILENAGNSISIDPDIFQHYIGFVRSENSMNDKMWAQAARYYAKLPYPFYVIDSKLTKYFGLGSFKVTHKPKAREITVSNYINYIGKLPELADNVDKILDNTLKLYDEEIKMAKELYSKADISANKIMTTATKLTNVSVTLSSCAFKAAAHAARISKKNLQKASESE